MTLRAAFMGSPPFAVPSLHAVSRACDLRVVVCQPDRPAGRGRKLRAPAVKAAAADLGVPVLQPRKMKDGSLLEALRVHELDVAVVVAFGRIIPPDLLALPRHGFINVHASVLPRWRGAAPIQRAILAGDTETGVSIMKMDEGLDTGPVFSIARTPIEPLETSGELFERLAEVGARTLEPFLADFAHGPAPRSQNEAEATHAPLLRKEEGEVDWHRRARDLVNHVRGMDPWPAAWTQRGADRLKLFGARPSEVARRELPPGSVVDADAQGLHLACLDGTICIGEIQPPGKRRMPAAAYAAGRPFAQGEVLGRS